MAEWRWMWGGSKVSKVFQILEISPIIAFLDTYEVVSKVLEVSRWLAWGDGWMEMVWGGGKRVKSVKSVPNIGDYQYYSLFWHYEGIVKIVKSGKYVQMVSFSRFFAGFWAAGGRRLPLRGWNAPQNPLGLKKNEGPLTPRFCRGNGDFVGANANVDKKHKKMSLLQTIFFTA